MKKLIVIMLFLMPLLASAEYPYKWQILDKSRKHVLGACVFIDEKGLPTDTIYKLGIQTKDAKIFVAIAGNKDEVLDDLRGFRLYVDSMPDGVTADRNHCNSEEHNPQMRIQMYAITSKKGKVILSRESHSQDFKPEQFQKMIDKIENFSL